MEMLSIELRISITTLIISLIILISIGIGHTDELSDDGSGILVENARVYKNHNDAERAELKFSVTNYGNDSVTLLDLDSDAARDIEIYILLPDGTKKIITNFTILQEESLNLESSHLVIDLVDPKKPLEIGDKIPFRIIFRNFETHAIADVH